MTTNADLASDFLAWMRDKRQAQPNTIDRYRLVIAAFAAFGAERPFAAVTVEDVEEFIARPRRTGSPAPATVVNELATLRSLYSYLTARHGLPVDPTLTAARPRVHNRQPNPVDDDTWLRVWTSDLPGEARVALGLGFFCGLRREEITTLRGSHVWGGALVNFTRKGGGEDRFDYRDVLDHFDSTMPELQPNRLDVPLRWLARTRGDLLLLPWEDDWISPSGMNKRMRRWLADAGLAPDAFTPHMLRHSFATNLLRSGVPLDVACDLCNHSSPTITMRYVRTSGGRLRALRSPNTGITSGSTDNGTTQD